MVICMVEIDELNVFKIGVKVQGCEGRVTSINIPKILMQNGLDFEPSQEIVLCLDKKNKILYIPYGGAE